VQCTIQWTEERDFNEIKVREREIVGEGKGCYNKFIQDPDPESDPKLAEKSDPDPDTDPKKIISDPQPWNTFVFLQLFHS
jgi:hypothetical protein